MSTPWLERAARHAASYLETVPFRPVGATATGDDLRRWLGQALPAQGGDPAAIIDTLAHAGMTGTVATQGPRYFGFVVGGSVPVATAADVLVSAWDQNAGVYVMSPIVAVIEDVVSAWIKQLVGLDDRWSTGFVTGCQMANFTCLAAARHHVLAAADWDVERLGLAGAPAVDVIVSDESHYTIVTALRLLGFGSERLHRIDTDGQGRMRLDRLEAVLSHGRGPCIVCAQAGNVNTGAFDPIAGIAAAARARGAWLHVDGAFGLWAAASPRFASLTEGITQADSIATDAHKWLNVPYDCGVALTAHREAHRRALLLPAHYIQETHAERDPHEFTPEESRRGRAVPVYAALAALGRDGVRDLVERCCDLARRMADRLSRHPRVRLLNDVVLNQVLVQCLPAEGGDSADACTRRVIKRVQDEGTCWLGGTVWQGTGAMRISIANWSTTAADIDRSAAAILAAVEQVR